MPVIQWFPGHMAKARREVTEKLKLVDLVIELRDARIPYSSKNPLIEEIVKNKPRLVLLNKANMADKVETKKWLSFIEDENKDILALDIDCLSLYNINKIIPYAKKLLTDKIAINEQKGIINNSIRAIVLGIPNVGKSTFINTISKRKATLVGDKPGVTRGQSWIKVSKDLMLLDTPGILWPRFDDQMVGMKLAITGSIKDEILPLGEVCFKAVEYLVNNYEVLLKNRYKLDDIKGLSINEIIEIIAVKRGCIIKGGEIDTERVFTMILNDIRRNQIGEITFERREEFISI